MQKIANLLFATLHLKVIVYLKLEAHQPKEVFQKVQETTFEPFTKQLEAELLAALAHSIGTHHGIFGQDPGKKGKGQKTLSLWEIEQFLEAKALEDAGQIILWLNEFDETLATNFLEELRTLEDEIGENAVTTYLLSLFEEEEEEEEKVTS